MTGEVFRQQLLKLWPISVAWPYILALCRCKRAGSILSNDTNTHYRHNARNIQDTQMDITFCATRINDDNDSFNI